MKKQRITGFIGLGYRLGMLRFINEGITCGVTIRIIDNVLRRLDTYDLTATRRCAKPLEPVRETISKNPKKDLIGVSVANKIVGISRKVDTLWMNESPDHIGYFVTEKRLRVDKLLDDVGGLFMASVFDRLPEIAREDLTDAGRCIAFDLPTPAASMLLRATEGVLGHFYCSCVRQRNKRIRELMWGGMLRHLQELKTNRPSNQLLNELDQLRQYYRNPTQHPKRRYTLDEVQDVFSLCVNVINQMASHPRWKS